MFISIFFAVVFYAIILIGPLLTVGVILSAIKSNAVERRPFSSWKDFFVQSFSITPPLLFSAYTIPVFYSTISNADSFRSVEWILILITIFTLANAAIVRTYFATTLAALTFFGYWSARIISVLDFSDSASNIGFGKFSVFLGVSIFATLAFLGTLFIAEYKKKEWFRSTTLLQTVSFTGLFFSLQAFIWTDVFDSGITYFLNDAPIEILLYAVLGIGITIGTAVYLSVHAFESIYAAMLCLLVVTFVGLFAPEFIIWTVAPVQILFFIQLAFGTMVWKKVVGILCGILALINTLFAFGAAGLLNGGLILVVLSIGLITTAFYLDRKRKQA